jgi:hypothetical protein
METECRFGPMGLIMREIIIWAKRKDMAFTNGRMEGYIMDNGVTMK